MCVMDHMYCFGIKRCSIILKGHTKKNYCEFSSNNFHSECEACQLGKNHKLPFSLITRTTIVPFEIIHTNVLYCGMYIL